ncbi:hypothetical protein GGU10DRAFT_321469 [Lentinula aff. detonsa]|uniref:SWIM-type domain-containing protein n=1 Tax=Lentinula aff. detonsa TaxID=2804958 RepID=A0AA38NNE4_9AGAR|nr:hypothetical protein GGU10DRAFT_321469 [Lentinula aff. detonsa]
MINESHWQHIKHDFLHYFHRPRVDLLVWILVAKLTPTYQRKLNNLTLDIGRYRGLAGWRKAFKQEWKKLEWRPITLPLNPRYRPQVKQWACTCPSQAPNRFLLCKHLVQGVKPKRHILVLEVTRLRTAPFWQHPSLIPKTDLPKGYVDRDFIQVDIPNEQQLDPQQNEPEDGNESDGEEEEYEYASATYTERMDELIGKLRSFADGLHYQKQFRDVGFLNTLEKHGSGFFRMLDSCLDKERRQNHNGGAPTRTWDPKAASAMFYRTQPKD